MKKIVFLILLCNIILFARKDGISDRIDSLDRKLQYSSGKDRTEILFNLSLAYKDINNKKGVEYGIEGVENAKKFNQLDEQGIILTSMGFNYLLLSKFPEAIKALTEAIMIGEKLNNPDICGAAYNDFGLYYFWRGRYDAAVENFFKALKYRRDTKDKEGLGNTLNNLGLVFNKIKDYNTALKYLNQSLKIKRELKLPNAIIRTLTNIALSYKELGNYSLSRKILDTALILSNENNYIGGVAICMNVAGDIDYQENNYKSAFQKFTKALEIYRELSLGEGSGIMDSYMRVSRCYEKVNNNKTAILYLDSALMVAKNDEQFGALPGIYDSYSVNYEAISDFKYALKYSRLSAMAKDSTLSIEKSRLITEMQTVYQIEEKEKELQHERLQMKYALVAFAVLLIFLLIAIILYYQKRKTNYELRRKNIEVTKQRELLTEALSSLKKSEDTTMKYAEELKEIIASKDKFFSIIAHDLRGPFTSIIGLSQILAVDSHAMSKEQISTFSNDLLITAKVQFRFLENLLDWARIQTGKMEFHPEKINALEEIQSVVEVLKGMALRKEIQINNNIQNGVYINADKNMFNAIVRNTISNSIKFSQLKGVIKINSQIEDGFAKISIVDKGIGIDKNKIKNIFKIENTSSTLGTAKEKGTGLGLILCKELVEKHGGEIIVTSKKEEGTVVSFTIPIFA
jgi:signal transduction histidine kinase